MSTSNKVETVKVTIEIPAGIAKFLTDLNQASCVQAPDLKAFAEEAVRMQFEGMLGTLPFTIFDAKEIGKWYGKGLDI